MKVSVTIISGTNLKLMNQKKGGRKQSSPYPS